MCPYGKQDQFDRVDSTESALILLEVDELFSGRLPT